MMTAERIVAIERLRKIIIGDVNRLTVSEADLCTAIADLLAELTKLRAVVERLPKTADGVLIRSGMKVYAYDPVGHLQGYDVEGMALYDDSTAPSRSYTPFCYCYSTLAAAQAAKETDHA